MYFVALQLERRGEDHVGSRLAGLPEPQKTIEESGVAAINRARRSECMHKKPPIGLEEAR